MILSIKVALIWQSFVFFHIKCDHPETNKQRALMNLLLEYFNFSLCRQKIWWHFSLCILTLSLSLSLSQYTFYCLLCCMSQTKWWILYYTFDAQKLLECRISCLKGTRHIGHIVPNDAYDILDTPVLPGFVIWQNKFLRMLFIRIYNGLKCHRYDIMIILFLGSNE